MELECHWCDNVECRDFGKVGAGNIKVFSYVERRYYCRSCRHTFSADKGTFWETVRSPQAVVLESLALLNERNSLRAAGRLKHRSPNRLLGWLGLAGPHSAAVSEVVVHDLHLSQVQVDELWTFVKKTRAPATRRPT